MHQSIVATACLVAQATLAAPPPAGPREIPLSSASGEALSAFRRGRDLFESSREFEARPLFEKAVALDPRFAFAHAMLAQCLAGAAAAKEMDAAAVLSAPLGEAERTQVAYWRALQRGNDAVAEASLSRLGELAADDWRIELLLGERAVDEGKGATAVQLFRRAVDLEPQAAEAYNHLGFALSDLGQHDAAISAMRRYAALKRGDPNPFDSLGEVLLRANRLADAESSFRRAALNPQFWYAAAGVATSLFLRGDFDAGRAALREELGRAPDPAARVRLEVLGAWSYLAQGRRQDGLAALESAAEDARAANLHALYAEVPVTQAAFHVLSGEAAAALPLLRSAADRVATGKFSGAERNALEHAIATWRVRALSQLRRMDEAGSAMVALEAQAGAPGNRALASAMQGLRPAVSEGRGELDAALRQTAACAQVDWLCRAQRVRLLEKRGDSLAAAEARRALLAERRRDSIWISMTPTYLWVWSQFQDTATGHH